jgi:hypothetical protein
MKIDIFKISRISLILLLIGQIIYWAVNGFNCFSWICVIPEIFIIGLWVFVEIKF